MLYRPLGVKLSVPKLLRPYVIKPPPKGPDPQKIDQIRYNRKGDAFVNIDVTPLTTNPGAKLIRGPMTVASFMREVLLNPLHGYYMNRNVFGQQGDFVTSPEISQMFGEMFGLWCVQTWMSMGSPKSINLIEFGPGRGTLMADMLKAVKKFPEFMKALSITFIEMSPFLRTLQASALGVTYPAVEYFVSPGGTKIPTQKTVQHGSASTGTAGNTEAENIEALTQHEKATQDVDIISDSGLKIHWRLQLKDAPPGPSLIIAHEFFDALAVHQFQIVISQVYHYTNRGWREILLDFNYSGGDRLFRFLVSPGPTLPSTTLIKAHNQIGYNPQIGDTIEVSGEAMSVSQQMGKWLTTHPGAALIVDYGHNHPSPISLRAIKNHKFEEDVLDDPGNCDLSCDVDFSAITLAAKTLKTPDGAVASEIQTFGPVTQQDFLKELGIETRLALLLQNTDDEKKAQRLIEDFNRLVNEDQMGRIYKVLAITSPQLQRPNGFYFPSDS